MVPVTTTAHRGHSGSFCSQELTLPHPELSTQSRGHASPRGTESARTHRLRVQPVTSSQFPGSGRNLSSTTTLSWAEQPRTPETLKRNCFTRGTALSQPQPLPHNTDTPPQIPVLAEPGSAQKAFKSF